MTRRGIMSRLGILLAVGVLAGCTTTPGTTSGPSGPSGTATPAITPAPNVEGGTVTIRFGGDWGNPVDGGHSVSSAQGIALAEAMYSTLVHFDRATFEIVPYLAESWTVTPTSVTFKLRKDVTCSDGSTITPKVVHDSLARFVSPELASRWPTQQLGPGPYTLSHDDAAGTFTFSVEKPFANLLMGLADARAGIICEAGLKPGVDFTMASYGSGPFVFDSAIQGDEYIMTKREGWIWGPNGTTTDDSGFPDRLVWKVITTDTTAANLLLTGGIDLSPVSGPDVDRMLADSNLEHQVRAAGAPYLLAFNHEASRPTANEAVRKAVMTALDPKAWTTAAGEPDAPISTNIQAGPGGFCYTDLSSIMPTPSVEGARQILIDDGYTAGADGKLQKDGAPLTLRVIGTGFTGAGVEYIADTLEQVGVAVDLVNTDYATFAQNYGKTDYDVVIGLHGGDQGIASRTALFMIGTPVSEGGSNRLNRVDPKLQELAEAGYGGATTEESCKAWEEFNRYVIENSIARPWAAAVTHWFSRSGEFAYVAGGPTVVGMTIRRLK